MQLPDTRNRRCTSAPVLHHSLSRSFTDRDETCASIAPTVNCLRNSLLPAHPERKEANTPRRSHFKSKPKVKRVNRRCSVVSRSQIKNGQPKSTHEDVHARLHAPKRSRRIRIQTQKETTKLPSQQRNKRNAEQTTPPPSSPLSLGRTDVAQERSRPMPAFPQLARRRAACLVLPGNQMRSWREHSTDPKQEGAANLNSSAHLALPSSQRKLHKPVTQTCSAILQLAHTRSR